MFMAFKMVTLTTVNTLNPRSLLMVVEKLRCFYMGHTSKIINNAHASQMDEHHGSGAMIHSSKPRCSLKTINLLSNIFIFI